MNRRSRVLVLNYHRIAVDDSAADGIDDLYVLPFSEFSRQMNLLKTSGIPVVSVADMKSGRVPHPFAVCITVDDGYASDYEMVGPLLESLNFPATFFPVISFIGKKERMNWEQITEISKSFSVGSHGVSHTPFTQLHAAAQLFELVRSKKQIEDKTGKAVLDLSLPYGLGNRSLFRNAAAVGYRSVFTTKFLLNKAGLSSLPVHRWNLRRDISHEVFSAVILRRDKPDPARFMVSMFKSGVTHLLGHEISNRLNRLVSR